MRAVLPQTAVRLAYGLLGLALGPGASRAEPFSYRSTVEVGSPARPLLIQVEQQDAKAVLLADHRRAELAIAAPQRADVQTVALAGGQVVAIVRVTAADGRQAAALVGRNAAGVQIVWTGALDPRGDPGEREGHVLEVQDQTGDGVPDVLVGRYAERVRLCGQQRTTLDAKVVDAASLKLRAVALDRLGPPPATVIEVEAVATSPGPTGAPIVRALRLDAVSSLPGGERSRAPTSLTDGNTATYWSEASSSGGRGEFATFRWEGSGFAIHALAVVPWPTGLSGQAASVLRTFWLVGENGLRVRVRVPERPEPGRRYWVKLSAPLRARCFSLVLDDASPLPKGRPSPVVLAEVEAYSELDFGGGVERLVQELSSGGQRAGSAEQLLGTLGPSAVEALAQAWPKLSLSARRRAIRVLAPHAKDSERALAVLTRAVADADNEVSDAAFGVLLEGGSKTRAMLLPRIAQASSQGDAAARALAKAAPREAVPELLGALSAEGGSERTKLREALALAAGGSDPEVLAAIRTWNASSQATTAARASLALGLARLKRGEVIDTLAAELVASALPSAVSFEDRFRLVEAASSLPPSGAADPWLARMAREDERWMLRAVAIAGLSAHGADEAPEVARAAFDDSYPRVRVAAAQALAKTPGALDVLAKHATRDRWAMVRAAALDALAEQQGSESVLQKGLKDGSRLARAAALHGLTKRRVSSVWPAIKERLEDRDEWPEVLLEAIAYARALCRSDATKALLALLRRGMKPDAWARDADVAIAALEALINLGGQGARDALLHARSPAAPVGFRAAAERLGSVPASCSKSATPAPVRAP